MKIKTILFDLDNTLVQCNIYYTFIKKNIYLRLSKISGLPISTIVEIFDIEEKIRVSKSDAFSPNSFKCTVENVVNVVLESSVTAKSESEKIEIVSNLSKFALEVYNAPYSEYSGLSCIMNELKSRDISVYIVTKGDFNVQLNKLKTFAELFEGVFVLPKKNVQTWNGVINCLMLDPSSTLVVGDSISDDINPAIQNGMHAVLVDRDLVPWAGDPQTNPLNEVIKIKKIEELLCDKILT